MINDHAKCLQVSPEKNDYAPHPIKIIICVICISIYSMRRSIISIRWLPAYSECAWQEEHGQSLTGWTVNIFNTLEVLIGSIKLSRYLFDRVPACGAGGRGSNPVRDIYVSGYLIELLRELWSSLVSPWIYVHSTRTQSMWICSYFVFTLREY